MSDKAERVIAFLDTNFCLHFPHGDQVDWLKAFNAKTVTVCVCLGVFDELEQMKADKRMGKRAAWWLKKCLAVQKGGSKPMPLGNAELDFFIAPAFLEANEAKSDPKIMAQAHKYASKNPNVPFFVVTDDGSFTVRLMANGLNTVDPNDFCERIKDEMTEAEKKVIELKKEIDLLKSREPELALRCFAGDKEIVNEGLLEFALKKPVLEQRVKKILDFIGWTTSTWDDETKDRTFGPKITRLTDWCENEDEVEDESARTIEFYLQVENVGSANAEGVEVVLTHNAEIMGGTIANYVFGMRTTPEEMPKVVQHQYLPADKKARANRITISPSTAVPYELEEFVGLEERERDFNTYDAKMDKIHWRLDLLKHGRKSEGVWVSLTFTEWETVRPVTLGIELHSDNPPSKKFGRIVLKPTVTKAKAASEGP